MVQLNLPIQFYTDRLAVSRVKYEDAEEIFYAYASKPEATRYVSWPTHKSLEDTRSYLKYAVDAWQQGTVFSFSVRNLESARLIGSIGIVNLSGKLQVGYIFSPTQWGHGYATEALNGLLKIVALQPGLRRIQSFIDKENVASGRVLRKCGFIEESRLRKDFRFINQGDQLKDCVHFIFPLEGMPV